MIKNKDISKEVIGPLTHSLENHSVYEAINSISDYLRVYNISNDDPN